MAYRFARSELRGAIRRPSQQLDSSHGVHRTPLRRHSRLCVHSRLNRRPDFGPGLPRPEHVPFLPFLPAPTVSSAEAQSEDWTLDSVRVCCTPQPALGFTTFPAPLVCPCGHPATHWVGTSRSREPSSVANTLRSFPLLGSHRPYRHRITAFRLRLRSPAGVPSHRFRSAPARVLPRRAARTCGLRALFHRGVRCGHAAFPLRTARCSHGLLDRTRSDAAAPCLPCAAQRQLDVSPRGSAPLRRPRTRESVGEAKSLGFVWLRTTDVGAHPKVSRPPVPARWQPEDCYASGPARPIPRRERSRSVAFGSGATRRRHLGRAPSRARRHWRSASSQPEGSPPRRSVSPEGARSPANRVAPRRECRDPALSPGGLAPVVRAATDPPSAVARIHEGRLARRRLARPKA